MATLYNSCLGSQIPVSSLEYLALWYIFQTPAYFLDLVEPKHPSASTTPLLHSSALPCARGENNVMLLSLFPHIEDFSLKPFRHSVHRIYIVHPECSSYLTLRLKLLASSPQAKA